MIRYDSLTSHGGKLVPGRLARVDSEAVAVHAHCIVQRSNLLGAVTSDAIELLDYHCLIRLELGSDAIWSTRQAKKLPTFSQPWATIPSGLGCDSPYSI